MSTSLIRVISKSWGLTDLEVANLFEHSSADMDDRVRILYSIHASLADLFVQEADEARWLRDPLPILGNISPLECMLGDGITGIARVQDIVELGMANR